MEFLYLLESLRCGILDAFFSIITILGEETAFMLVGMTVFWCVSKYEGYCLLCTGFFGTLINQFLKILCRNTRGDRCRKDQDVLALDHGQNAVTEDHLAALRILGRDHVNGLVRIHIHEVRLGQGICKACADDLGAVQTQDGVHRRGDIVIRQQLLRHRLGLRQTHLLGGHVDIIIGMAVTGGKMATGHAQKQILTLRRDLERFFGRHSGTPYRDCYLIFYTISRKLTRGK